MDVKKQNRDIESLSEPFKSKVKLFLEECKSNGLDVFITEALRSKERQEYLYSLGRTVPGRVVTWTLKSKHLVGHAIDIAFRGQELYPSDERIWNKVFDIGEKHGIVSLYRKYGVEKAHLEWGGTIPVKEVELINYPIMDDKQKQLVDNAIYSLKNMHNYGTPKMKEFASDMAKTLRELKEEKEDA